MRGFRFAFCTVLMAFLSLRLLILAEEAPYTLIANEAYLPILTMPERQVMKMRLANGLEAYLISDPKAEKSAAVVTVQAGSWEDPEEYPGLAHFLEHMLFLGTSKYPEESEYGRFIAENGGARNAFTAGTHTSYMFSINHNAFEEALDRFSYFFKEPLFNPSGVNRELHAVNQEHAKNFENDDVRAIEIVRTLVNPKHPFSKFSCGNLETLSHVDQKTLKDWYQSHYSANLMHLIVYSPLSLEKLTNLVVSDFQDVPNHQLKVAVPTESICSDVTKGKIVYIEPSKHNYQLTLLWDLPPRFSKMLDSQPIAVLSHILGHEGEESLLSELKREDLVEKLECGSHSMRTNTLLFLDLTLTEKGVKHLYDVVERVFQAIALLQSQDLPRYIFDDLNQITKINYQYQQREEAFQYMFNQAGWIIEEELSTYPEKISIVQQFDPVAYKDLFRQLSPHETSFYLSAPIDVTGIIVDRKEKWMGTGYTIKPVPSELLERWETVLPHPSILLPKPNAFIPKDLQLIKQEAWELSENGIPQPRLILDTDLGQVYFAGDVLYRVPHLSWSIEIKTPSIDIGNATKTVLADLYIKTVKDALNPSCYPASLAGLTYEIARTEYGIRLDLSGFNENAELLLEKILIQMKTVHPSEEQFRLYQELLLREYQNHALKLPVIQAIEQLNVVLKKAFTTEKKKASAIERVTFDKFQDYCAHIFDQIYVKATLYGNMHEKQAKGVAKKLTTLLGETPYLKHQLRRRQIAILPQDQGPFYWQVPTKAQGNAVILAIQNSYDEFFKGRAIQQVIMQAMKDPFFSNLRTQQQTGYIVWCEPKLLDDQLFSLFIVQSNTHATRDLLARFELFIEGYLQEISQRLPKDRYELVKQAQIDTLKQPPQNYKEMGSLLHKLAFEEEGDFYWVDKNIKGLQELQYAEFVNLVKMVMGRQNKQRIAVLLEGIIPEGIQFHYLPIQNMTALRKLCTYTYSLR